MSTLIQDYQKFVKEYQSHLLKNITLTDFDIIEYKWRRFNYHTYLLFVIFIGLPVWYFTTTPYRATLPYFSGYSKNIENFFFNEININENITKKDVWNQIALSSHYNIHLIFVHDEVNDNNKKNALDLSTCLKIKSQILDSIKKFANYFNESIQVELSAEHFWDFSLKEFLLKHFSINKKKNQKLHNESFKNLEIESHIIPTLTAEIDRYSMPLITSNSLIKIVIFLKNNLDDIYYINEKKSQKNGLIVASWGGFVTLTKNSTLSTLNAIFVLLRTELGIFAARQKLKFSNLVSTMLLKKCKLKCLEIEKDAYYYKIQSSLENLNKTIIFINSLHDLTAKIEDLVISKDIAKLANLAYKNFFNTYESLIVRKDVNFDSLASVRAKIFAEKAVTHSSLIEFLNFPADQKYGIYVPLFFPICVPLFFPFVSIFLFYIRKKFVSKIKNN